jgi:heat shock protein HslJ
MATNNIERLAITTKEGHSFTYSKKETKVGGDKDEHGCIPSAGYSRNEDAQECQRPREQNPPTDTAIENPRDILDGKEFSLTSLNGETISGSYLISFGEGKLSTKFCNSINGSYSIDENGKMSGILMSTLMACLNQEPSTLESKFAIDGAEVKTEEKSLTLTTKNNDIFVWQQK